MSLLLVVALAAAIVPGGPFAAAAGAKSSDGTTVQAPAPLPPPPPPGPIPDSQRQEIPAPSIDGGVTNPPVYKPILSTDPTQITSGLTKDASLSSSDANVYQVNGADHLVQVSSSPLNYLDSSGQWVPIQATLVPDIGGGFTNAADSFAVHFPVALSMLTPVAVDLAQGSYTFAPEGMLGVAKGAESGDTTLAYTGVLSGTDLQYTIAPGGLFEAIVLHSAAAPSTLTFDIQAKGLTLATDPGGGIDVLAGGQPVGLIPAPEAIDASAAASTGLEARGQASYALTDKGGGAYTLSVSVDPAFLSSATYPVTVDPGQVTLSPERDTSVIQAHPTTGYESDSYLYVGYPTSGSQDLAFVSFNVGPYASHGRIVETAQASLLTSYAADSSVAVLPRHPNQAWPNPPMTWNNRPSVDTNTYPSATCSSNHWCAFDLRTLYENIINKDVGWSNWGFRLGGGNSGTSSYHTFYSSETGYAPSLFVYYDDPPSAPSLATPTDGTVLTYSSPTLRVNSPVSDPNGDPVLVNYQISSDSTFATHVTSSGWVPDSQGWTVPAGVLADGQTYHWRAQAWDECDSSGDMCDYEGVTFNGQPYPTSAVRSLTVTLSHLGDNAKWPMWSDSLGNGVQLEVNEASGNAYLRYPLDSLDTPAGPLDLALTFNHQDTTDYGLGQGWQIAAGPGSDLRQMPTKLATIDSGNDVELTLADGDVLDLPKQDGDAGTTFYAGTSPDSGVISKNSDGTWIYTTQGGGRYAFDTSGKLTSANPQTSSPTQAGFSYAFNAGTTQLASITDPLGRQVIVHWTTGTPPRPDTITTWDNRVWHLAYYDSSTGNELHTVTDPVTQQTEIVSFSYATSPLRLTSIQDGFGYQTAVQYSTGTPPAGAYVQVTSVTDAGNADPTTFAYSAPYTGQVAGSTAVTDPRGNATGANPPSYTTTSFFDTEGLPVKVVGPTNGLNEQPTTQMAWDTNGNLVCKRGPAAVAVSATVCVEGAPVNSDGLETDYTYDNKAPFAVWTRTDPAPNPDGTGGRALTTYHYDEGINGYLESVYAGDQMSGIPAAQSIDATLNHDWGTGHPDGITNSDHFSVRWTGILNVVTLHNYHFRLWSDDGSRLLIGPRILTDCYGTPQSYQYNCGSNADAIMQLWPGRYPITVEYQEQTGNAHIDLRWDNGSNGVTFSDLSTTIPGPGLGLLTSETDPLGATSTYAYQGSVDNRVQGLPVTVTTSGSGITSRAVSYTYDSYGRVLTTTTPSGVTTNTYSPDSSNLVCLTKVVDATGAETDHTCDAAGDVLTTTVVVAAKDSQGGESRLTTNTYDAVGRLLTVTTPDGTVTANTYGHGDGRLTRTDVTDTSVPPNVRTTLYAYDTSGRLQTRTDPDPDGGGPLGTPVTTWTYDEVGNVTQRQDPRLKNWTYKYDGENRVTESDDPISPTADKTTTVYDDTGQASGGTLGVPTTTVTGPPFGSYPNGVGVHTAFDLLGRKTSAAQWSADAAPLALPATTYAYDAADDVSKVTDPTGVWTSNSYDVLGEMTGVTTPTGTGDASVSTVNTYDTSRNLSSAKDAGGNTTSYGYDAAGRITQVTPPGLGSGETPWAVEYDSAGERTRVTDPDGRIRDWTYDPMGRMASAIEYRDASHTYTTGYAYDGFSGLTTVTDPRGLTITYTYDSLGRKISQYSGTSTDLETYAYNATSQMNVAQNSVKNLSMVYDDAGRISQVKVGGVVQTSYLYTGNELSSRTDVAGTTSFAYDSYGRTSTLTDPFTGGANTTFGYDNANRMTSRTDLSGLTTTRTFDTSNGELASEAIKQGATTVASFSRQYDQNKEVTQQVQSFPSGSGNADSGTWNYTYDAQNRLKTAALNGITTTYGYDGAGNRNSVQVGTGAAVTTAYDNGDHPTSSSDSSTYAYDAAGNMTSKATPGGTWSFSYDTWDQQTSATGGTYTYDALGRLTTRTPTGGSATTYRYVGISQDPATSTTAGTTTGYAWDSGGPLASSVSGAVRAFEQDMHGNVALVANTSATVTGTAAYGPFGEPRVATGETSYFGFQADPTDPITAMVDLGTRLYDPSMGRFSTQDVMFGSLGMPVSLNQYAYASDSPVSNSDPNGMCTSGPDGMDGNCGAWSHPAGDQYQYWHPVVTQGNDDPMRDANGPRDWSRTYGGLSSIPPPRPAPPRPVIIVRSSGAFAFSPNAPTSWSYRLGSDWRWSNGMVDFHATTTVTESNGSGLAGLSFENSKLESMQLQLAGLTAEYELGTETLSAGAEIGPEKARFGSGITSSTTGYVSWTVTSSSAKLHASVSLTTRVDISLHPPLDNLSPDWGTFHVDWVPVATAGGVMTTLILLGALLAPGT